MLHVVPPASSRHQQIEAHLIVALEPLVRRRGWYVQAQTGVLAADDDYRVPDVVVSSPASRSERGVDGAPAVVVEIRSPGDESDAKVPWYLGRGAVAVPVVDRDSLAVELHGPGGPVGPDPGGPVGPDPDGGVLLEPLGVRIVPAGGTLAVGDHELRL